MIDRPKVLFMAAAPSSADIYIVMDFLVFLAAK
jgi:hypothetical protein